jgi:hypothetical protein
MSRLARILLLPVLAALLFASRAPGPSVVEAQKAVPAMAARPFEPSEQLFYEAEFSRSLLRKLDVADFKLSAARTPAIDPPKTSSEAPDPPPYLLTLSADIASKGFFTRLFNLKFRERIESVVEPVTFTVQRNSGLDEQGKRVRATEMTFDRSKGKMYWTQRDPNNTASEPRTIITDFSGQLQDVLSAIYFIRTHSLEVGKKFEIFIGNGGRIYRVPINVIERKRMKTVLGKVHVLRVEPDLFGPDKLIDDEKGQFQLWLTDDSRHVPVSVRVKTSYGTFDISLKRAAYNPQG